MRNAAIADTSATHNHSKEKIKLQKKIIFIKMKNNNKNAFLLVGW